MSTALFSPFSSIQQASAYRKTIFLSAQPDRRAKILFPDLFPCPGFVSNFITHVAMICFLLSSMAED